MKNNLKFVLLIIFSLTATEMNAQLKTGYVFGMNLSTVSLKIDGVKYHTKTPVGFHFGGFLEFPLNNNLALQSGLLFSAKGTDYDIDTLSYSISPIYLEVPVNAILSFGSETVKVSFFTGPYLAFGIGGYKIDDGGQLKNINYGTGAGKDIKTLDLGLNFGVGVNLKGLLISLQYGLGLTNVSPIASNSSEMKNQVIGISIRAAAPGLSATIGR